MTPQYDVNKKAGLTDDDLNKLAEWISKQKSTQ